jgi:PAS domain S-box-containing protein
MMDPKTGSALEAEIASLRAQLEEARTTIRHFVSAPDVDSREPIVIEPPLLPIVESIFRVLRRSPFIFFRTDLEGRVTSVFDPHEPSDIALRETIGMQPSQIFPPAVAAQIDQAIAGVVRTGQAAQLTIDLQLPTEEFWYELGFSLQRGPEQVPRGVAVMLADATDRRIADRQVRLLAQTVASTMDAVVITDLRGIILFANDSLQQVLGFSVEEILGKDLAVTGALAKRSRARVVIARATREGGWHGEVMAVRKDGTSVPMDVWTSIVRNDAGVPVAIVAVGRDISAVKQAEQVQKATYHIASAAGTTRDLRDLCHAIHNVVSQLMPARNFYIAEYDEQAGVITFPYWVDEHDPPPALNQLRNGLTEYLIQTAKPLLASPEVLDALLRDGTVRLVGTRPVDWLGVPLILGGKVLGALVVQTYSEGVRYTQDHLGILMFVSTQIALAIDRKRRDDSLRESEERFRTIYNNTPVMLHSIDPEGRLLSVSDYWLQVSGYRRTEVIGRKATEFLSAPSARYAEDVILPAFFKEGRCDAVGLQFMTKEGKALDVLFSAVLERDGTGKPLRTLAVYEDITDRTLAERALVDSEERYRGLFEDAAISLWEIDGRGFRTRLDELHNAGETDFARHCAQHPDEITRCLRQLRVVDVNRATLEMFGATSKTEFVKRRSEIFRPGSLAGVGLAFIALSEGKTNFSFETPFRTIDGRPLDAVIRMSVAHGHEQELDKILLSLVDITKRKRAEEALRESEARLQTVFESIPFDLWVCGPDGKFLMQNPVSIARWGNLVGKLPIEVNPKSATLHDWQHSISRTFAGEMVAGETQVESEGSVRHLYTVMTPIWEDGSVIGIMGLAIDNTERKLLQQRLLQSQKLESIGTLAGGIAHDFNNILGIIMGHASLLPELIGDLPRLSRSMGAIQDAGKRGASLVRQILTFARKTDVKFVPVDLNEIVFELARMLQETFPRTITFHLDLDAEIPRIEADRTQIHQTLLNLCVNARDAMPAGGTLTIQTKRALPDETNPEHEGSFVRVTVADTGIGMDEPTRRRVFEPFFTTKGPGKGTGLGLAVVYGIMEGHGGFISLESAPSTGSRFNLFFPLNEALEIPDVEEHHRVPQERGSGTILVVEDEAMMADLLQGSLERAGYTVLVAGDGEQGLSVFESLGDDIALVVTDIGLPRMPGDVLFRRIRALRPSMKVIIATGYLDPDAKAALEAEGATAFIQKPYLPRDVLRKVRDILNPSEPHSERVSPRIS